MYCLFCDVLCIVRVYMRTELLPPGDYPIAVKYIISFLSTLRVPCHSHKKECSVSYKAVTDWSAEHRHGLSSQRGQLIY